MINAVQQATGIEGVLDALANMLQSYEFDEILRAEHAKHAAKIPYRRIEYVYTEDMENLSGYPAVELIATRGRQQDESPRVTFEISAQVTVNGDDEQRMGREARRLINALRTYLNSKTLIPYFGGSPARTGDADFGPIVRARNPTDEGKWLKSAALEVFVDAYSL
jgi:hypothetical protein